MATGLQIAESLVPRVPLFPWLRLGLSWAILLPFLLSFGVRPAISLFMARNVLSLTFGGQPPSTFLVSSLSGVFALLLAGGVVRKGVSAGWLGWIGAGVGLAACFNGLQLGAVTAILVGHSGNLFQLGPILAWSVISGTLVAWLARSFWNPRLWFRLGQMVDSRSQLQEPSDHRIHPLPVAIWSTLSLLPFVIGEWRLQTGLATALCLQAVLRKGPKGGRILWQSWPYFAFLAWLHLLDTPGHFLSGTRVTSEGLVAFALHAGRLAAFLFASQELVRWIPWRKVAPNSMWARGIGLALPLLPVLFSSATRSTRSWWKHRNAPAHPSLAETILRDLEPDRI